MEFTQDQFFQAVAPCKTPRIWIAGIAICGQRKLYHRRRIVQMPDEIS